MISHLPIGHRAVDVETCTQILRRIRGFTPILVRDTALEEDSWEGTYCGRPRCGQFHIHRGLRRWVSSLFFSSSYLRNAASYIHFE